MSLYDVSSQACANLHRSLEVDPVTYSKFTKVCALQSFGCETNFKGGFVESYNGEACTVYCYTVSILAVTQKILRSGECDAPAAILRFIDLLDPGNPTNCFNLVIS